MLRSFTVHSFKSLKDVSVDLGVVNVFIGANGSGKSNLLEAIGVLSAAAAGRIDDEALFRRGVRPGVPSLYKSSFHNVETDKHIYFQGTADGPKYGASILNPMKDPSPAWKYKTELLECPGYEPIGRSPASLEKRNESSGYIALRSVEMDEDDPRVAFLERLANYAIYSPDTPRLRGLVPDGQTREPVGLAGGRLAEGVSEVLGSKRVRLQFKSSSSITTQILEMVDWLQSFGTRLAKDLQISPSVPRPATPLMFQDRYMAQRRDIFSGYEASEGVLYLLFGMVLALHPKSPQLFAVDNFDHALNPRIARAYTAQFCGWMLGREGHQALLTSHNPLVLDGLPLLDDNVRLFAVDRKTDGSTAVRRVKVSKKVLDAAEKGIPLSRQWVMGNIGGVPDNV